MNKKFALFAWCLLLMVKMAVAQAPDPNMGIIPAPVSVKKMPGEFVLSQSTVLSADTISNKAVQFFASYLKSNYMLNNQLKINKGNSGNNTIVLTAAGTDGLPAEGYRLTITPQQVTIAGKGAGLFYGIQTLLQLLPLDHSATAKLSCVQIEDYPRFGYRGMHLDVSRHFFGVEFVKKYIDLLAYYKLNTFHWHLTDDQGWRVEIKKWPKLTSVGSQRAGTLIGNYHDRTPQFFDNVPVGGFYTQDQIRDVVKYAADRYINIVPEVDIPGHSLAALAAYPEFSCDPSLTFKVGETWGDLTYDVLCPTEETFAFLQDVMTEIIDLFPSKYIHIGGDEVNTTAWKKSDYCQKMIKRLKLKDEKGLQSYIIQRMEKFVNSKGRNIIGWDEILDGGLAPNATVMSWRGEAGGIAAAKQSHNVIMTPSSGGLYFDHAQGKVSLEPVGIGGASTYQKVYSYNPVPAALTPDQQKYIMGVQANLWCEYIATEEKVEYMLFPRLMALSETAWTPLGNKNIADFEGRLPHHLARLDKNGINYRVGKAYGALDTMSIGTQININLTPSVEGAKIYYSIDGYAPGETTLLYDHPFTLTVPQGEYRELQTMVITPAGHRSLVSHAIITNRPALPAVAFAGSTPGVKYKMVGGMFTDASQLDLAPVVDTGAIVKTFNTTLLRKNKGYGIIFTGYINVDTDGKYQFATRANDGANILIDDQPVVVNDAKHDLYNDGGEVLLQKGYHKFTLKYFDTGATPNLLHVYMTMPGKPKGELSAESLLN